MGFFETPFRTSFGGRMKPVVRRNRRLPLMSIEHEKASAILDAVWLVVKARHDTLAMTKTGWKIRNKAAALVFVEIGWSPERVVALLRIAYEHPVAQNYFGGMVMLAKLQEHAPKLAEMRDEPPRPSAVASNIVPFGKYIDKPMQTLLADKDYCAHMIAQPSFRERYRDVYNIIVGAGITPTETPEHNLMQAHFLDDEWCLRIARALGLNGTAVERRRFEYKGWDVVFDVLGDDIVRTTLSLECKPSLGDDYPAVLRQVQKYPTAARCLRAVVVQRYAFEAVTWEQVVAIFASSGIAMVLEPAALA